MRFFYSCEIAYQAEIARDVTFAHNGLGVVIGHSAVIGHRVHILHNVTIGGRTGHKRKDGTTNPHIGNDVLIGAGACVLGPISVQDNAKIGANAVVISDIPANAIVVGIPAKIIK